MAQTQRARSTSSNGAKSAKATRPASKARATRPRPSATAASGNGSRMKSVVLPAATAVVGVAAGAIARPALARKLKPTRRVMGVSVPSPGADLTRLSKQVGKAAKEFGRLAGEINQARTQAEKVGKALS